jgi:hypothetical protein
MCDVVLSELFDRAYELAEPFTLLMKAQVRSIYELPARSSIFGR